MKLNLTSKVVLPSVIIAATLSIAFFANVYRGIGNVEERVLENQKIENRESMERFVQSIEKLVRIQLDSIDFLFTNNLKIALDEIDLLGGVEVDTIAEQTWSTLGDGKSIKVKTFVVGGQSISNDPSEDANFELVIAMGI